MGMEFNFSNKKTETKKGSSERFMLANKANLEFAIKSINVKGKENIDSISKGAKVIVITTHLTDLDIPVAIEAVGHELDLAVMNLSTHHKFWGKQGEISTNIGIRIAGKENFIPIDYHKNESGQKSPEAFNPENFTSAVETLEKGKSVMIAAHNPSKEPLQDLNGVKGGYGGVYLALLTDSYILPTTVILDKATGMYGETLKTIKEKPNASVVIGKPFKLGKIEGIEHFAEITKKRENGEKLTEEERKEFLRLANVLREKSQEVIRLMSEQLITQN
jgi:hypothetical protein